MGGRKGRAARPLVESGARGGTRRAGANGKRRGAGRAVGGKKGGSRRAAASLHLRGGCEGAGVGGSRAWGEPRGSGPCLPSAAGCEVLTAGGMRETPAQPCGAQPGRDLARCLPRQPCPVRLRREGEPQAAVVFSSFLCRSK